VTKQELIEKLERQLAILKSPPDGFDVREFRVWYIDHHISNVLGDALVRYQINGWSWGYCKLETCSHHLHDPYTEGDLLYILCKSVGKDEEDRDLYLTPDGSMFYVIDEFRGHDRRPFIRMGPA